MLTHACAPHTVLQVAVKTTVVDFSKVSEQDAAWVCENAVREAEIVSVLSHPNIITTYSYKLNGGAMPADCLLDLVPEHSEKRKEPWQLDLVQVSREHALTSFRCLPQPVITRARACQEGGSLSSGEMPPGQA